MANEDINKESGYDQKAFLQIRLHELLSSIDKLNFECARLPLNAQSVYQKAIFQNLTSVFCTIYSKLTPAEKEKGKAEREKINNAFGDNPISKKGYGSSGKYVTLHSTQAVEVITELLFEFRFVLEEFMDKHGFNPSKKDKSTSIVD
jgi:hypothetical protein